MRRPGGPGGGGYQQPKQHRRPARPLGGPGGGGYQQPKQHPKHPHRLVPGGPAVGGLKNPLPGIHRAPQPKRRGLARSAAGVACCAAEALAASLRLTGGAVADEDVLALYWHTAGSPDAGASILTTLEAAWRYGVGGHFPAGFRPATRLDFQRSVLLGLDLPEGPHTVLDDGEAWWSWGEPFDPAGFPGAVIEEAWAVSWHD